MNMESLKLVVAAVAPCALLLALLNWRGRPWPPIVLALGAGALAGVPAYYLEGLLLHPQGPASVASLASLLVLVMLMVGLVEEGCKMLGFYLGPARTPWYTDEYDGIVFAATVSLGFAGVENIFYILGAASSGNALPGSTPYEAALHLALTRGLLSVPLHTCCGIVMGSYLGRALVRQRFRWSADRLPLQGLGLAMLLHGVYDFFAFQNESVVSDLLLKLIVVSAVVWSFRICRAARRRSPAYGGHPTFMPLPTVFRAVAQGVEPRVRRNPYIAGALGIAPGLGQYYNGEPHKALAFVLVALFNVVLYYGAWLFVHHPEQTVQYMTALGVVPNLGAHDEKEFLEKLALATEQKWMLLPLVTSLCLLWEFIGAIEAYLTASQPVRRPQDHEVRRSFLPHGFGTSYVLHLLAVLFVVFTPIIRAAAAEAGVTSKTEQQGGQPASGLFKEKEAEKSKDGSPMLYVTWVERPTHIDGYKGKPEGTAQGKGVRSSSVASQQPPSPPSASKAPSAPAAGDKGDASRRTPATAQASPDGRGPGMVVLKKQKLAGTPSLAKPRPPAPSRVAQALKAEQRPKKGDSQGLPTPPSPTPGIPKGDDASYNEYISYRIRVNDTDGYYFHNTSPRIYSVVEYTILKDGSLADAHLIKTAGTPQEGELAVEVIRRSAPFTPLPGDVRGVKITELFWTRAVGFPPGSIEDRLSKLPDGRYIQILK